MPVSETDKDKDDDDGESNDEESDKDTPEKSCEVLNAQEINIFAVLVSDGMMDFLEPEHIAYVFAAAFFVKENPYPHTAAEHLILHAAEDWSKEHITAITNMVLRLRPSRYLPVSACSRKEVR
jgi:serine/threonine protein phosphatase PrpC